MMRTLTLEWERRTAGIEEWELIRLPLPVSITTFEAQSMAAGLRAEGRNIRGVQVLETKEVNRYLT